MSKNRKGNKESKKTPLLTHKEKRAEKKNKKKTAATMSVLTER
jgi:hypothetical protein